MTTIVELGFTAMDIVVPAVHGLVGYRKEIWELAPHFVNNKLSPLTDFVLEAAPSDTTESIKNTVAFRTLW